MICVSLLVVVRELEEKLLMAVKEKENLEDLLQDWQTEVSVCSAKYPVCPLSFIAISQRNCLISYFGPVGL